MGIKPLRFQKVFFKLKTRRNIQFLIQSFINIYWITDKNLNFKQLENKCHFILLTNRWSTTIVSKGVAFKIFVGVH